VYKALWCHNTNGLLALYFAFRRRSSVMAEGCIVDNQTAPYPNISSTQLLQTDSNVSMQQCMNHLMIFYNLATLPAQKKSPWLCTVDWSTEL